MIEKSSNSLKDMEFTKLIKSLPGKFKEFYSKTHHSQILQIKDKGKKS